MKNIENTVKRICSLYVNDWHLTTMLLPHISTQISAKTTIITMLEHEMENNVKELLSKINLNEVTKNKILEIDWTSNNICKYNTIKSNIENKLEKEDKIEIIINGSKEYIQIVNKEIEKCLKEIKRKRNKYNKLL